MRPHHARAVERLRQKYEGDPRYRALIVVGSVATGEASEGSDVDHMIVATDEEYARRVREEAIHYSTSDLADYPGGYVEGKFVDYGFLEEADERGSEPARAQFVGAKVIFSDIPGLAELVASIAVYPEAEREGKIRTFYSHMMVLRDYLDYGEQKGEPYIVARSAADVALFAGRLILAHNRILYPYHKWFPRELRRAPEKPEGFLDMMDALVKSPTTARCDALCSAVIDFMDLGPLGPGWISRFVIDTEWNWRHGRGAVEDW